MMWLLGWWPYALSHHLNPFLTDYVWAPVGFNFAWMTSIPLPALLSAPLTHWWGIVPAYNVLAMVSAPAAAVCAFALCHRLSHAYWPSVLGGFVYGYSSFMVAQTLGHLCLILSFPIPLAAYLVLRRIENSIRPRTFIALLALTFSIEFLTDLEIFATASLIGGLVFLIGFHYASADLRRRLIRIAAQVAAAYAITAIAMSPYIYYFLFFGRLHQPLWPSKNSDRPIKPRNTDLRASDGAVPPLARLSSAFPGTIMEQNGFIATPLIVIAIVWTRRHRSELLCRTIIASAAIVLVAAIGPYLQIAGHPLLPMPWLAIARMPLLEHALPARLMMFPPLAFAVVVTMWLTQSEAPRQLKAVAVLAITFMMLPNLTAGFWATPVESPRFFSDGSAQRHLSRADIVLTLPWGARGQSMLWQAHCGMCFRNVAGWTGVERFEVRRWPIVDYFGGSKDLPEPELQLKTFLARNGVTAVIVDESDPQAAQWKSFIATTGVTPISIAGVSLFRLPPDALARYHGFSGLQMETRATRLRFETLLAATDAYLAAGHPLARLTAEELAARGFLPPTWKREPHGIYDIFVTPWSDRGVVIGQLASPSALKELIDRYRNSASEIYLPYPKLLSGTGGATAVQRVLHNLLLPPTAMPVDGESMEFIGIAFDRQQLNSVAAEAAGSRETIAAEQLSRQ